MRVVVKKLYRFAQRLHYEQAGRQAAMNESKVPNGKLPQQGTLEALHRQHAIWTTKKLRFLYPKLTAVLYESDGRFIVHLSALTELKFSELQEIVR